MKTAKVKITWEFELPVNVNDSAYKLNAKALLIQNIFDDLINYSSGKHLQDAMKWLSKSKGNEESTEHKIYKHHEFWADLLTDTEKNVKYEIELPKETQEVTQAFWIKDDGVHCPFCGVKMTYCGIVDLCSKEKGGCGLWCDGIAHLTREQYEKYKDIVVGPWKGIEELNK